MLLQDVKDREVYWFLFPVIGLSCGILLFYNTKSSFFLTTVLINLLYVSFMFFVIFLYAKLKLETSFKNVFGLGDLFLFLMLSLSFSNVSFIILFVFSLIFSLVIHIAIKHRLKNKTVPLAGYMSLFFALTYLSHWIGFLPSLYLI